MKYFLAIDLGASSGRHIVGFKENGELKLKEVHRFHNGMMDSPDGLIWDTESLFNEIVTGIKKAVDEFGEIESLSIDTWGVDYVLINGNSDVKPHYAYRNSRVDRVIPKVHEIIPFEELYKTTGIQFASFNTIYQLYDDLQKGRLNSATDFLMIPEYFEYLLTGKKVKEYTDASTTGLLDAKTGEFSMEIINELGFPKRLFPKLVQPGATVGYLKDEIAKKVGCKIKVVASPAHDTASAFEAVDCPKDSIIISSGTWSLIGVKLSEPNTSAKSFEANFTNEGGVGYIRYLKNIMGMWIANQAQNQTNLTLKDIDANINSSSYKEVFDVNDKTLAAPKNMKEAIINLLKHNPPKTDIDLFASIYRSLANSYKVAVEQLENTLGQKFNSIYIVGGGARNAFLNRVTEEVTGKKVVALPIEATAIGNIKTQIKVSE